MEDAFRLRAVSPAKRVRYAFYHVLSSLSKLRGFHQRAGSHDVGTSDGQRHHFQRQQ